MNNARRTLPLQIDPDTSEIRLALHEGGLAAPKKPESDGAPESPGAEGRTLAGHSQGRAKGISIEWSVDFGDNDEQTYVKWFPL
jgi:hypothetical protein